MLDSVEVGPRGEKEAKRQNTPERENERTGELNWQITAVEGYTKVGCEVI